MAAQELHGVDEMGVQATGPSHARSSHAAQPGAGNGAGASA